ncbi:hypothetical protein E2C01_011158 [Portunus trituberculatus]|uniref:Uncharacterized protein n=1 Tax=Portunus trituberculatus TaxID=210409 RepID=A0A5B7DAQ3_PORTR|nr:hypothetical protein [Portunus trituberculatus]
MVNSGQLVRLGNSRSRGSAPATQTQQYYRVKLSLFIHLFPATLKAKTVMDKPEEDSLLDQEDFLIGRDQEQRNEVRRESLREPVEEETQEEEDGEENTSGAIAISQGSGPQRIPPLHTSASFPRFTGERTPLLRPSPSFVGLYGSSWSTRVGPSPYTADNKPKR